MGCSEKTMLQISLYVDDALNIWEKNEFTAHLKGCEECRRQLEDYVNMREGLKEMPWPDIPAGLHDQVMLQVRNMAAPIEFITKEGVRQRAITAKRQKSLSLFKRHAAMVSGVFGALLILGLALGFIQQAGLAGSGMAKYDGAATPQEAAGTGGTEAEAANAPPMPSSLLSSYNPAIGGEMDEYTIYLPPESFVYRKNDARLSSAGEAPASGENSELSTVKEFHISLEAENLEEAMGLINAMDGGNDHARAYYGGDATAQTASVTRRVPAADYERAKNALSSLGRVVSEVEREENVSYDVMTLSASLRAKQAEADRLRALLAASASVDVMVAVENQLGLVEDQKDDINGQLLAINDRVRNPYLYVDIAADSGGSYAPQPVTLQARLAAAFVSSLKACVSVGEWLLVTVSALALPLAVAVALFVASRLVKRAGRRDAGEK